MSTTTTIGIDFGTYNSEAAYILPDGKVILLQAYHGPTTQGYTIPSFIKFHANGEFDKYGEPARQEISVAPHLVVWGIKRLLEKSYQKAKDEGELDRFQYPIKQDNEGSIIIPIGNKIYTPVEISKIFLEKVKADCESDINPINGIITKAVITHPAYFDSGKIEAVKAAANRAGFEQIELISEPEAAALAYKDIIDFKKDSWIMVIDWGAGTLDIVITKFHLDDDTRRPKIESVFPPYGDNSLGGIDMDDVLFEEAKSLYGLDPDNLTPREIKDIRSEIEKGKIDVSSKKWVTRYALYKGKSTQLKIAGNEKDIPSNEDKKGWIFVESVLNRSSNRFPDGILGKFKTCIQFALKSNGQESDAIDQLILVGGPMYMPCVRAAIADIFQDNDKVISQLKKIDQDGFPVSPFEAVVRGAAIYGSLGVGGIETSKKTTAYGYGYLFNDKFGEILIPIGTTGGLQKDALSPITSQTSIAESIHVSLLKSIKTPDGDKYYKIGDYKFVPIITQKGTAFVPILEMDKDLIVSLTIKDLNSSNPSFRLKLSKHQEIETIKPMPIVPFKLPEDPVEKENVLAQIEEQIRKRSGVPISADIVNELSRKGEAYVKFIEVKEKQGIIFSNELKVLHATLKRDLKNLPKGQLPPEGQVLYQAISSNCEQLKNILIENPEIIKQHEEVATKDIQKKK